MLPTKQQQHTTYRHIPLRHFSLLFHKNRADCQPWNSHGSKGLLHSVKYTCIFHYPLDLSSFKSMILQKAPAVNISRSILQPCISITVCQFTVTFTFLIYAPSSEVIARYAVPGECALKRPPEVTVIILEFVVDQIRFVFVAS